MQKLLLTLASGLVTLAVFAGAAQAGDTGWLDRDRPSGVGEYETTKDLLKIECRFKKGGKLTGTFTEGSHPGYHCNVPEGGWCKNNVPPGTQCQDVEVKFSW